jgi:hypothetical protein
MTSKGFATRALDHGHSSLPKPERRSTPRTPYPGLVGLQRAAGNQAVDALIEHRTSNAEQASPRPLPDFVEGVLQSGSGRPLDPAVLSSMQSRFNHDFSGVRVHADAHAHASADAAGADAYAVGEHVVFAGDRYAPSTTEGARLLAHELAHVVQQSRGGADPESAPGTEAAAERAAAFVSAESAGPVAVEGASGVGLARQRRRPEEAAKISHFEDNMQTVVFDRPVSIEEASQVLWRRQPSSRAISPDPREQPMDGRQRRFKVDVKFEMTFRHPSVPTPAFRRAAEEASAPVDVVQQLVERGLPPDIASVAPTLPFERQKVTDIYDVSATHALHARWERFWGRPVVDWETEPGRKEITREFDVVHRFPGVWTVEGKQYPGDWLVKTKNGVVEAWHMKPPVEAYVAAANGDEDIGRRQYGAAIDRQNLILSYWQEGHSLDDAMGQMRADVELKFKSDIWGAAGLIQSASGLSTIRPTLAHEIMGGFPRRSEPPGMAARRTNEPAVPSNMRARVRESREPGQGFRGPRMRGRSQPPEATAQRLRATGTEPDVPAGQPMPQREGAQVRTGQTGTSDVPMAVKGGGGTRKPSGTPQLPDPRQFDPEPPSRVPQAPIIRGAGTAKRDPTATSESSAQKRVRSTAETEEAVAQLETKRTSETGQKETRYGVKQHSENEWSALAGHAMQPHVVEAWATPLEGAGFTVYRTDRPAGPNLAAPTGAQEGAAPQKEFVPSWYESKYQPFPPEFSQLFAGEGPDAIAVSQSRDIIVVFDVAPTYSASHFQSKAALALRVADAFPQSRVYVQEGYWGEPTTGGGYRLLSPRLVRPSVAPAP